MASVEKEAIDDFSAIFQENYDKIPKEQDRLRQFFIDVNKWYYKKTPKDLINESKPELVYQYLEEAQAEFLDFQTELSAITKAVYLVVKDVSQITGIGTESYQKSDYIRKEGEPESGQRQVINVGGKPSIWHKWFGKKPDTNIPKSLEDAWIKSEDWKEEIRNIPNVWRKLVLYHHYGVEWQDEFDGFGMRKYKSMEIVFFNTRVEPLISNIVSRSLEIRTDNETEKIERIYTGTLQLEKELETARIMTQQQESQPSSP